MGKGHEQKAHRKNKFKCPLKMTIYFHTHDKRSNIKTKITFALY